MLENYLKRLQENIYANPVQTRPKPKPGITGEKPKTSAPGLVGPTGMEVDLDKDEKYYDFINKIVGRNKNV